MTDQKKNEPDFEKSLKELETLVEQLEQGDLPLDKALEHFEKGVALTRNCQAQLKAAEQKVQILMEGRQNLTSFDHDTKSE